MFTMYLGLRCFRETAQECHAEGFSFPQTSCFSTRCELPKFMILVSAITYCYFIPSFGECLSWSEFLGKCCESLRAILWPDQPVMLNALHTISIMCLSDASYLGLHDLRGN